jgi:hypothetical protein
MIQNIESENDYEKSDELDSDENDDNDGESLQVEERSGRKKFEINQII